MKHLRRFNEDIDYSFKTKEQLDDMSKDEIKDYRYDIIQYNAGWSDPKNPGNRRKVQSDWKQYLEELELYQKIRFKEDELKQYDKWLNLAGSDGREGDSEYKVVADTIITVGGVESMYDISIKAGMKKVGEFKYIKI